jgi:hypothetical protein
MATGTKTEAFDFIRRIRGRDGSRKITRNSAVVARATDSPPPCGIRGFRCAPAHPGEEDERVGEIRRLRMTPVKWTAEKSPCLLRWRRYSRRRGSTTEKRESAAPRKRGSDWLAGPLWQQVRHPRGERAHDHCPRGPTCQWNDERGARVKREDGPEVLRPAHLG